MATYEGFLGTFLGHVARTPEQPAVIHSRHSLAGDVEEVGMYAELDASARRLAVWLQQRCAPGDRALLLYPQGLSFVRAFLGCLYAGVAPVVAPPAGGDRRQQERTAAVARDAGTRVALTEAAELETLAGWLAESGLGEVAAAATDDDATFAGVDPREWARPVLDASSTAFLQYTSGSTSTPRGVIVSHGNLEHNARVLTDSFGFTPAMPTCSWLPMFHDMGLILTLLTPLYLGSTTVLLAPADFLRRPQRWLELISRHRAAITAAPNFAFDLCVRRVTDEQIAELDLSGWLVAVSGAEPIDPATLARFTERFAPAGFRAETFAPGYGLAETTLGVSGTPLDEAPVVRTVDAEALSRHLLLPARGDGPSVDVVSSGLVNDFDVRIVDPQTLRQLPDGEIGEVWVSGTSVTQGYWRKPEETDRIFQAVTADGEGPFLRTGDLGALDGRRIYVTGRLKEMLIIHGRNLYPHDIERELRAVDELFAFRQTTAFSVRARQEEVVVVQELRAPDLDEPALRDLADRVKAALGEALGVRVGNVVFVRTGQICRTTSGKLQRNRTRALFEANALDVLYESLLPDVRARFRAADAVPATAAVPATTTGAGVDASPTVPAAAAAVGTW
ncbi:fatty acyl-AMP ligase [Kitasatospora sp. NPDC018619]|uniref:fatty acyl-AMP ligase n=1 Tax=unclassified Kitasatospora TaxID=2633591 RepID=UPI0037906C04